MNDDDRPSFPAKVVVGYPVPGWYMGVSPDGGVYVYDGSDNCVVQVTDYHNIDDDFHQPIERSAVDVAKMIIKAVNQGGFDLNELVFLYRVVLEHIISAEEAGVAESDPSSVFRVAVIEKLTQMRILAYRAEHE